MELKALREVLAKSLDQPFQMGWQTVRSMADACWSLQTEDRAAAVKILKEGIGAFAGAKNGGAAGPEGLPCLYWLGTPLGGGHALQVFCCDALGNILEGEGGGELAAAIGQAPAGLLEQLDWPQGYPAWLPAECLRFALRNWKKFGQARAQAPGEAMVAALKAGDAGKLARMMGEWGPLAPMAFEEDESCCYWNSLSGPSGVFDTFARRALLEWGACPGARGDLEAAGVDFGAPFPGSDASWADMALLLDCRAAYEGLGGRMDDPDGVARAAVSEADSALLAMALDQGADPMPLLAESLTKNRALSGSQRMLCARLLVEHGASASEAVDENGKRLLEAFLDGWELWETYLDESGLSMSDFVPDGLAGEDYGRIALKVAKGIWEICMNGPSSIFDDPAPSFPDLKPGRETMDYVDGLLSNKGIRPPGWAAQVWPALRSRLEKGLISGQIGPGAKGRAPGKPGGI